MTEAVLDYKFTAAGGNVRTFLTSALEGRAEASGRLEGVSEELFAAVDAVEAECGPLSGDNVAGFLALTKHVEVTAASHSKFAACVPGEICLS